MRFLPLFGYRNRELQVTVAQLNAKQDAIVAALNALTPSLKAIGDSLQILYQQGARMETTLEQQISALTAQVAANTTVEKSASTLIKGFAAQLDNAIQAAHAQGVKPSNLQALNDLSATLKASDDDLSAAIAANTSAPAQDEAAGPTGPAPVEEPAAA